MREEKPFAPEPVCIGVCPRCGEKLYGWEAVYMDGREIVACECCVEQRTAADVLEVEQ